MNKKAITTSTIKAMKQQGEPITMVTAYDVAMARNVNEAGVEMILVGDSVGNVMLGYGSTVPVTMEEMLHHTKAVMRACGPALVQKMVAAGIPVVGHIGLTPQAVNQMGGFKVQGKDVAAAQKLLDDAKALEAAGAFAIVLECVPAALAAKVTAELKTAATIGIGAGNSCDGQVLVCNDLLGFSDGFCPKFAKKYSDLHGSIVSAVQQYIREVKERSFPAPEHTFKIDDEVLEKLY